MNWLAVLDVAMPGPKVTPDEKGFAGWIIGVIVAALIIVTISVVCIRKSIKKHKEVVLLKDILGSIVIVTQRNRTRKGDIYNAIQYCALEQLPLAKVTILK